MSSSQSQPQPPSPLTILAFISRSAAISQAEFHHHWQHIHAPLVAPWAVKHGFISYSQIYTVSELQSAEHQKSVLAGYDGVAKFTVRSEEDFMKAFEDPYYRDVIAPDEVHFVDRSTLVRVVGGMRDIVAEGKVCEGVLVEGKS